MEPKIKHFMYTPFVGLGLYGGFRGNSWLKNRIKIFKQFVVPSLQAQICTDFTLLISWTREMRHNPLVQELVKYMETIQEFKTVHTYNGVLFYDDKYPHEEARLRLIDAVHTSMGGLMDAIGECTHVLFTIQPSDDCYHKTAVKAIQQVFKETDLEGVGFTKGYICNYLTKEVSEYNPTTNPPFYTIKFPRETFIDPLKHYNFNALKMDVGKYKKGTACPSHEYVVDCVKYKTISARGFLVGVHGVNISTNYNIPYKGQVVDKEILKDFGLDKVAPLKIHIPITNRITMFLPYKVQRKLRYIFNEWKWYKLSTYKGLIK